MRWFDFFTCHTHTHGALERLLTCELARVCGAELQIHLGGVVRAYLVLHFVHPASLRCACGLLLHTPPYAPLGWCSSADGFGSVSTMILPMATSSLAVVL